MEKKVDLDTLLRKPTPQDVTGAIFAFSGLPTFDSDRKRLHRFIREKKGGEGAALLEAFVFSEGVDLYPFSRLLESVLMQLQLGGWLSAKNPEYDRFGMTDEIRDDIKKKVADRFTKEELEIVKEIGAAFGQLFKKEQQK